MEELNKLSTQLLKLGTNHDWQTADETCRIVSGVFGIDVERFKLWHDPRIVAEASRFMTAFETINNPAAYEVRHSNERAIDIKLYWMKKSTKTNLSWVVGAADNFEDSITMQHKNIGIDLVIPESCDRVFVIISNQYKLRVLELHNHLSITDREILTNVINLKSNNVLSLSEKTSYHSAIWDAFNFEPINKRFYRELVDRFIVLRDHLTLQNNISLPESVSFATRLIGRLLFVKFLDKKGLINSKIEYFSAPSGDSKIQTTYYKEKLEALFYKTLNTEISDRGFSDIITPYLNGGLFDASDSDFYNKNIVTFPDNYFNIFQSVLAKYNFTVDESSPEFQQVAVDPEMLGRIFESLLGEMETKEGDSLRSATGAFYTSREIVSYMCEQSVLEYLKSKIIDSPERDRRLMEIITMSESLFRDQDQNKRRDWKPYAQPILDALETLTVLDPAVGSGAYPMGMLHLLIKIYTRLDSKYEKNLSKLKRDILSRSLYGSDISTTAIEICRLRAWLSLIVDISQGEQVVPLPNLEFHFVCANSLISLSKDVGFFDIPDLKDKMSEIRRDYYSTNSKAKKQILINKYQKLLNPEKLSIFGGIDNELRTYTPFTHESIAGFFDPELMLGQEKFNIVIGNPPYVSTKGVDPKDKKKLEENFGFSDDLYSHFYFKGLELCEDQGVLSYITSKTFWTIQTKKNVRELLLNNNLIDIYDTANPFESVMVDTCVVLVQKDPKQRGKINFLVGNEIILANGKKEIDYLNPIKQQVDKVIYEKAVNKVIFKPSAENLTIYNKYNDVVDNLIKKWWLMISTSKNITKYGSQLIEYRDSLKPGDVTLLGLITDGGQGLATGSNGNYVGVLSSSKEALKIKEARINKFCEFVTNKKITEYGLGKENIRVHLNKLPEHEVWDLFDSLKEKYGRDIFGTGFLYRIVDLSKIKNINLMSDEDKKNGLSGDQTYVPYDKGDKDGNRWYLRTPYYIDWSKKNVNFLKQDSKARFQGHQFYFRSGFCWSDIHTVLIKTRLKEKSIHDVKSMSMFSFTPKCTDKYLVCLLNSTFISNYDFTFINTTSSFQINDARQLPVIIPNEKQLNDFEDLFDRAYVIKISQFDGKITNVIADQKLQEIQKELDCKVLRLYDLNKEVTEII